jgi:hypothetical protein
MPQAAAKHGPNPVARLKEANATALASPVQWRMPRHAAQEVVVGIEILGRLTLRRIVSACSSLGVIIPTMLAAS